MSTCAYTDAFTPDALRSFAWSLAWSLKTQTTKGVVNDLMHWIDRYSFRSLYALLITNLERASWYAERGHARSEEERRVLWLILDAMDCREVPA